MQLDDLRARAKELQAAIESTGQQFHRLNGHKAEVDYQISLLEAAVVVEEVVEEVVE